MIHRVLSVVLVLGLCLGGTLFILPSGADALTETLEITGVRVLSRADVVVSGTATLVAALNLNRNALSCTNNSGDTAVRWGESIVTATQGQRVSAGTSIEIKNHGAIYMISEGDSVTVSCTEESP